VVVSLHRDRERLRVLSDPLMLDRLRWLLRLRLRAQSPPQAER
jgi:hypothetical protein